MRKPSKKAFTMVELLLVLFIIGLLFVLLVSNMDFSGTKAKMATVKSDVAALEMGLSDIATVNQGLPETIDTLRLKLNNLGLSQIKCETQPADTEGPRKGLPYLTSGKKDPWGNDYRIYLCGAGTEYSSACVICAGLDGEYFTGDDGGAVVSYQKNGIYARVNTETIDSGTVHVIGGWSVTVQATCTTPGKRTPVCALCGLVMDEQSEEIPAEHQLITVDGLSPTCYSEGKTSVVKCAVCGTIVTASEPVPKIPHSYSNWTLLTESGTLKVWKRTCTVCGENEVAQTVNGAEP